MVDEIVIANIDELKDFHECKSIDTLLKIQIQFAKIEETSSNQAILVRELGNRFDELSKQIQQVLFSRHECHQMSEMKRQAVEIDMLKNVYNQQKGASRWQTRIDKLFDAVIIAVIVAAVLFFMRGGAIT